MRIEGVLFDLDGTLLDTAPDFLYILNTLRARISLPPLTRPTILPWISGGVARMIQEGLPADPTMHWQDHFLALYTEMLGTYTTPFDGILPLLAALDNAHVPWGVVTNKPTRFTHPLLQRQGLFERAHCVISGDTLSVAKPDPAPVIAACTLLQLPPATVVFCGDAGQDMYAGHRAGCRTVFARFGYVDPAEDQTPWPITHTIDTVSALHDWIWAQR